MKRNKIHSRDVRKRAAEIRSHWSPLERAQRTGLPPDIPTRLRQYILGSYEPEWSMAGAVAKVVSVPFPRT
jgi:hypothetical protein